MTAGIGNRVQWAAAGRGFFGMQPQQDEPRSNYSEQHAPTV